MNPRGSSRRPGTATGSRVKKTKNVVTAHDRPTRASAIHALLRSVAEEELSMASLIGAEAEKTLAMARKTTVPFTPREAIAHQASVAKIMRLLVQKERLLLDKLRTILALRDSPRKSD